MTLRLPAALVLSLLLPCLALAKGDDFGPWLAQTAAASPQAPYAEGWKLPLDFIEHLRASGRAVDSKSVKDASGKALTYAELSALWGAFARARPAADAEADAKADGKKDSPLYFTGVELGKGPHPGADPFAGADRKDGVGLGARVALDGLGVRAQYKPAPSWPTLTAAGLIHLDLLGSMNLERAREGVYAATFQRQETPQGGFEVAAGARFERWNVNVSYDDKKTSYAPQEYTRVRKGSAGVGVAPLGKNAGHNWNFGLQASPNYQVLTLDTPDGKSKKEGVGAEFGASFRYALNKVMPAFLQPPPKGNGVVWPDQAKASFSVAVSKVAPVTLDWAAQTSLFITRYVLLTPGVTTTLTPDGGKVGVAPLLGLDIKNPSDS